LGDSQSISGYEFRVKTEALHIKHLPIRALREKDGVIAGAFSPNTLYLVLTTGTEKIEADAVLIRLNHLI